MAKAKPVGLATNGAELQQVVVERLIALLLKEAEGLPPDRQQTLLHLGGAIVPSLVTAHSVLFHIGDFERLNLDQTLSEICSTGAELLDRHGAETDETLRAAQLTYESVGQLIAALAVEPAPVALVQAGIAVGRAEVRLTQVITGLWGIMAAADSNAGIAGGLAETRKSGGSARGAALKRQAAQWKAKMLPVAERLDREHPDWDRQKLAMELIFETDLKDVGLRSVEDWLKGEAEEPNGPIRSRARKQPAKQSSQVS